MMCGGDNQRGAAMTRGRWIIYNSKWHNNSWTMWSGAGRRVVACGQRHGPGRRCERRGGCRAGCRLRSSPGPSVGSQSWRSKPWRERRKTCRRQPRSFFSFALFSVIMEPGESSTWRHDGSGKRGVGGWGRGGRCEAQTTRRGGEAEIMRREIAAPLREKYRDNGGLYNPVFIRVIMCGEAEGQRNWICVFVCVRKDKKYGKKKPIASECEDLSSAKNSSNKKEKKKNPSRSYWLWHNYLCCMSNSAKFCKMSWKKKDWPTHEQPSPTNKRRQFPQNQRDIK